MLEQTCWMCHFSGPFGDTTGQLVSLWLLALLGIGFGSGLCATIFASALECGCSREENGECPDEVDCQSDVTFPCNVTSTHPRCVVLQRRVELEGMCTCYKACNTPPYSTVRPLRFSVDRSAASSDLYCGEPPSTNLVVILALCAAGLFTGVAMFWVGCGEPRQVHRMSRVAWFWPLAMLAVFLYDVVDTAGAMQACSDHYSDLVVGQPLPQSMRCDFSAPTYQLLGCAMGLLCACYLPVLLRMRYLSASGKGYVLLAREGGLRGAALLEDEEAEERQ